MSPVSRNYCRSTEIVFVYVSRCLAGPPASTLTTIWMPREFSDLFAAGMPPTHQARAVSNLNQPRCFASSSRRINAVARLADARSAGLCEVVAIHPSHRDEHAVLRRPIGKCRRRRNLFRAWRNDPVVGRNSSCGSVVEQLRREHDRRQGQ